MFALDTNILILYFQGDQAVQKWLDIQRARHESLAISTLSVTELLSYPKMTAGEKVLIEVLLRQLTVIDVDMTIARLAATLRSETKLKTIDSVIAATALAFHATLVTCDKAFLKLRRPAVMIP